MTQVSVNPNAQSVPAADAVTPVSISATTVTLPSIGNVTFGLTTTATSIPVQVTPAQGGVDSSGGNVGQITPDEPKLVLSFVDTVGYGITALKYQYACTFHGDWSANKINANITATLEGTQSGAQFNGTILIWP